MIDQITIEPAPEGSNVENILPTFGSVVVATDKLNGLQNDQYSAALQYANDSGQPLATVEVVINPITPVAGGTIEIVNGSLAYEITLTTETTARKLKFVDIPSSFLLSFFLVNKSGDEFPAKGNYIVVEPQY
jgi:hypothetical protein